MGNRPCIISDQANHCRTVMVNMLQKRAKKVQKRKQVVAQLRKHLGDNAVGSLA